MKMINLHTDLADQLTANELFLCVHIVRHMGANRVAWPSQARLSKLTKWSKNTVIKTCKSLEAKGVVSVDRSNSQGVNKYSVDTNLIGIYMGGKDLKKASANNELGGSNNELGASANIAPPSANNEPEVLSNEVLTNNPLTPKGEHTDSDAIGDVKKQTPAQQRKKNALKSLEFFNAYTGKSLTSSTYVGAFEKALKRGATSEDLAHAIYEQEYSTRKDKEKRAKFLTPLTVCRPANLARLSDAWRERSKEDQRNICLGSPQYQSEANANGLPWKDWPQIVGWKKCTTPGNYYHTNRGEMHYSEMIANRMAKPSHFPNTAQFTA